ncbi:MAG: WxcM-like domain-containing protein [Muribaculaceae bacterium]|nr:WxcM-like domain-containing protein [Muribaculaceae bacterium]
MSLLDKVQQFEFSKVCDPRGNLSFIEGGCHVPFAIKRVFYIYDVPGGETRGGHAHYENSTVLIAVSGSFDLHLTDGTDELVIPMNRSNRGVLIPPGVWDCMHNFTTGTVCLALCSHHYEEEDYIRDYDEYLEYVKSLKA